MQTLKIICVFTELAIIEELLSLGSNVTILARDKIQIEKCIINWEKQQYSCQGVVVDVANKDEVANFFSSFHYSKNQVAHRL